MGNKPYFLRSIVINNNFFKNRLKKRPAYEAGLSLCVRFANYFRKRMKI